MSQMQTTLDPPGDKDRGRSDGGSGRGSGGGSGHGSGGGSDRSGGRSGGAPAAGLFTAYKPEQGRWTRNGTLIGAGLLITWGAWAIYDPLQVFEGDDIGSLLITRGVPLVFAAACFFMTWRLTYAKRTSSDFMIATEGEMKKVNWSTRREVIGSTKVVIVFTAFLATFLFLADLGFQQLFKAIGALKS